MAAYIERYLVGVGQHGFIEGVDAGQVIFLDLNGIEETGVALWERRGLYQSDP